MPKIFAPAAFVVGLIASTSLIAQTDSTPGVQNVAPGVRVVNGAEVPSLSVDTTALEANIKEKHSFSAAKEFLGNSGVDSVGPNGTTIYMYKVHDSVTAKNYVVVLFVKDDAIVDYLLHEAGVRHKPASQQ